MACHEIQYLKLCGSMTIFQSSLGSIRKHYFESNLIHVFCHMWVGRYWDGWVEAMLLTGTHVHHGKTCFSASIKYIFLGGDQGSPGDPPPTFNIASMIISTRRDRPVYSTHQGSQYARASYLISILRRPIPLWRLSCISSILTFRIPLSRISSPNSYLIISILGSLCVN